MVSLMQGQWLCYGGGHFNGGRMVMLQRWPVCYRGDLFNGGGLVMLERWLV